MYIGLRCVQSLLAHYRLGIPINFKRPSALQYNFIPQISKIVYTTKFRKIPPRTMLLEYACDINTYKYIYIHYPVICYKNFREHSNVYFKLHE